MQPKCHLNIRSVDIYFNLPIITQLETSLQSPVSKQVINPVPLAPNPTSQFNLAFALNVVPSMKAVAPFNMVVRPQSIKSKTI